MAARPPSDVGCDESADRAAAEAAVTEIGPGMLIGLGTGSTARFAIDAVGRRVRDGLAIRAVATSDASERQARGLGIEMLDFAEVERVDLTIDGADEIDERCRAIKGAGGAMLREKAVAAASTRMVVIADGSKRVERLGAAKLPVEVLPFARAFVLSRLRELFDRVEGSHFAILGLPLLPVLGYLRERGVVAT